MDSETHSEAVKQLRAVRANAKRLRSEGGELSEDLADELDGLAKHMVIYIFDGVDPDAA